MTWYIAIGDDITLNQKIRFPFCRSLDEDYTPDDLIFVNELYECADPYVRCHPLQSFLIIL